VGDEIRLFPTSVEGLAFPPTPLFFHGRTKCSFWFLFHLSFFDKKVDREERNDVVHYLFSSPRRSFLLSLSFFPPRPQKERQRKKTVPLSGYSGLPFSFFSFLVHVVESNEGKVKRGAVGPFPSRPFFSSSPG